jgi:hypothetical protein
MRRNFTTEQHLEALDNDVDTNDAQHADLMAKLDRIQWTLVGLSISIAGSAFVLLFTQGLGN